MILEDGTFIDEYRICGVAPLDVLDKPQGENTHKYIIFFFGGGGCTRGGSKENLKKERETLVNMCQARIDTGAVTVPAGTEIKVKGPGE